MLVNERTGENPWGIKFLTMFHMSNDSHLFETAPRYGLLPLYEGKMVQAFDHRAARVITVLDNLKRPGQPVELTFQDHQDPRYLAKPQYHVRRSDVDARLVGVWTRHWLIAYKSVTSPTNQRTMIAAVLPFCGIAHSMNVVFPFEQSAILGACFLSNLNALVLDFAAKQKVGGVNLSYFLVRQLPFIGPTSYTREDARFIALRVLELVHTAWDIKPFADDLWRGADDRLKSLIQQQWEANKAATGAYRFEPPEWAEIAEDGIPLPPFKWNEDRRARIRAELDAYYALLYGLTRDELRYILDPKEVYGEAFPGETFRVLKEKEIKQFGEYRTRRLVLEAYDGLAPEFASRQLDRARARVES